MHNFFEYFIQLKVVRQVQATHNINYCKITVKLKNGDTIRIQEEYLDGNSEYTIAIFTEKNRLYDYLVTEHRIELWTVIDEYMN